MHVCQKLLFKKTQHLQHMLAFELIEMLHVGAMGINPAV